VIAEPMLGLFGFDSGLIGCGLTKSPVKLECHFFLPLCVRYSLHAHNW